MTLTPPTNKNMKSPQRSFKICLVFIHATMFPTRWHLHPPRIKNEVKNELSNRNLTCRNCWSDGGLNNESSKWKKPSGRMPQLKTHIGVEHRTRTAQLATFRRNRSHIYGAMGQFKPKTCTPLTQRGAGFGLNSNNTYFARKRLQKQQMSEQPLQKTELSEDTTRATNQRKGHQCCAEASFFLVRPPPLSRRSRRH